MEEKYKVLLKKFIALNEVRKESIDKGDHDYSLMASLLRINDEVRLHSRFIYSMINPEALHYRKNAFLKPFLNQIRGSIPDDFIDTTNAKVYLEKGDIDLLIHDGNNFLIIENKLDAVDQPNQLTRYVKYVQENFFEQDKDITGNVAVVYLSKNRSEPVKSLDTTKNDYSLIGFDLIKDGSKSYIEWKGMPEPKPLKLVSFKLKEGSKIPYVHMPYFSKGEIASEGSINGWIFESLRVCKETPCLNDNSIKVAFDEYQHILNRLDKSTKWKKMMTLSDYARNLKNNENEAGLNEQQAMYKFMVESRNSLVDFVAQVLFEEVDAIFNVSSCAKLPSKVNSDSEGTNSFNIAKIKAWLLKEKNSKNVGFIYERNGSDKVIFLLADWHLYISKYDVDKNEYTESDQTRVSIGQHREKLLNDGSLYNAIDKIKDVAIKEGVISPL